MELKPKQVTSRLNTLLVKRALEAIDTASATDLMDILQGFRKRNSKDMYMKIRKTFMNRKNQILPEAKKGEEKKRAELLVDLMFTLASNKPQNFGVYRVYARDELNEMLSHYEEDLKECAFYLEPEHLTRLAQALYLFKTNEYESVFNMIED